MRPPPLIEAAPGVWQIVLPWTRAYVLTDGVAFSLVDTGTCRDLPLLLAAIGELGLNPEVCRSILLTHGHCDHAGNAAYFATRYGAKVYAHAAEQPFLETAQTYAPVGLRILGPSGVLFSLGEVYWPVQRFSLDTLVSADDVIATPAGNWRVLHTPGHTPGHVSYFRESDHTLLSGDAILTVMPYTRQAGLSLAQPVFATDLTQARHSAHQLVALAPRLLLPGHGAPLREDTAARLTDFAARLKVN